jgi:8-oxo-dGTP diphosphatase
MCSKTKKTKLYYISEKFEFPEVKLSKNTKEALKRELFEELNITTDIQTLFLTIHEYPDFQLTTQLYL